MAAGGGAASADGVATGASGPDRPRCSRPPPPGRGRRRRTGTVVWSPPAPLSPDLCTGCAWAGQHPRGPEGQNRAVPTDETTTQPSPARWRILGRHPGRRLHGAAGRDHRQRRDPVDAGRVCRPTTATIQWVVSGYALAFGLTLVAGGRLGDVYGRRALMMIGLTGFILGSAASGLAADAELVIAARVLQGMSAGLLTPQSSGLIQQLFSGKERGIAFGYFGTTVGVASAIGPILGGVLIALFGEENGWRYIFGINVPIGLVAMIFIWRWVPGRSADAGRHQGRAAHRRGRGAAARGGGVQPAAAGGRVGGRAGAVAVPAAGGAGVPRSLPVVGAAAAGRRAGAAAGPRRCCAGPGGSRTGC